MANGGESLFSDRYMKTTVIYGVDQMSASIFNGMQIVVSNVLKKNEIVFIVGDGSITSKNILVYLPDKPRRMLRPMED